MTTVYRVLEGKGRDVWVIDPGATVLDALHTFDEKNIGALVVMKAGRVAGLFTERQYARSVYLKGKASPTTPVGWNVGIVPLPPTIWFLLKVGFFIWVFMWFRFTFPRYRYDQLMSIGWKVLLPLSLANILISGILMI